MNRDKNVIRIEPGTPVYVIDHWTGHCAHEHGEKIVVGPGGFRESERYPGYFEGLYTWYRDGEPMGGITTGLSVSLSKPDLKL